MEAVPFFLFSFFKRKEECKKGTVSLNNKFPQQHENPPERGITSETCVCSTTMQMLVLKWECVDSCSYICCQDQAISSGRCRKKLGNNCEDTFTELKVTKVIDSKL
jgi:hypothetical protein